MMQCDDAANQVEVRMNLSPDRIQRRILVIRGVQVMLDRDLAELYGVPVKRLNEQVRRNSERFPDGFMFQLSSVEFTNLKSQIASSSLGENMENLKSQYATSSWGGVRKAPKVFTEQGVAMLSAVLNSKTAVLVSVAIMDAFVKLRHFMTSNAEVLCRMNILEKRQVATDARVDEILQRIDVSETPTQGVFYDGQLWDACSLVEKLIGRAKKSILLIDSWVGPGTLDMLAKKRKNVVVEVVSSPRGNKLAASDIDKFNAQYGGLAVRTNSAFHDRFLVIDDKELYLIGASLKDLGRKCFAFTKLDAGEIPRIKAAAFASGGERGR